MTAVFAAVFTALYVAHQLGDHWIQTDHQAATKSTPGWVGKVACLVHVATYTLTAVACLAVAALVLHLPLSVPATITGLTVSAITHYIADRRTPLRKLAKVTGHRSFVNLGVPREGHDDNPSLGTGMYALDQSWHIGWLFIAALIITAGGGAP